MLSTILNLLRNWKVMLALYAIVVSALLFFAYKAYQNAKENVDRLEQNQIALTSELTTVKTENGKNLAKVQELQLTKDELEKSFTEQINALKEMGVKTKYVNSISTTGTNTDIQIETLLRDSIIYRYKDSITLVPITIKHFEWQDTWNKIDGSINNDKVTCRYQGNDTLNVAIVRVPKKFLFFKWGTKQIDVNLMNTNPYNKVTYNKTITIKK